MVACVVRGQQVLAPVVPKVAPHGVRVDLRPAEGVEERDLTGMAEGVVVALFAWGTQAAITAAVNKFRKR